MTSIGIFVGYNLINGLKGGIDNAAHIGGLVSGLAIGYAYIPGLKKPDEIRLKFVTIGILTVLVITASFVVYIKLPNDILTYQNKLRDFAASEAVALEIYSLPADTKNDTLLARIKDRGINKWDENIKLIDSFKELDLPVDIQVRNVTLKEYCQLRMKTYELLYKAVSENSDQYKPQIEEYNKLIEAKIKELEREGNN